MSLPASKPKRLSSSSSSSSSSSVPPSHSNVSTKRSSHCQWILRRNEKPNILDITPRETTKTTRQVKSRSSFEKENGEDSKEDIHHTQLLPDSPPTSPLPINFRSLSNTTVPYTWKDLSTNASDHFIAHCNVDTKSYCPEHMQNPQTLITSQKERKCSSITACMVPKSIGDKHNISIDSTGTSKQLSTRNINSRPRFTLSTNVHPCLPVHDNGKERRSRPKNTDADMNLLSNLKCSSDPSKFASTTKNLKPQPTTTSKDITPKSRTCNHGRTTRHRVRSSSATQMPALEDRARLSEEKKTMVYGSGRPSQIKASIDSKGPGNLSKSDDQMDIRVTPISLSLTGEMDSDANFVESDIDSNGSFNKIPSNQQFPTQTFPIPMFLAKAESLSLPIGYTPASFKPSIHTLSRHSIGCLSTKRLQSIQPTQCQEIGFRRLSYDFESDHYTNALADTQSLGITKYHTECMPSDCDDSDSQLQTGALRLEGADSRLPATNSTLYNGDCVVECSYNSPCTELFTGKEDLLLPSTIRLAEEPRIQPASEPQSKNEWLRRASILPVLSRDLARLPLTKAKNPAVMSELMKIMKERRECEWPMDARAKKKEADRHIKDSHYCCSPSVDSDSSINGSSEYEPHIPLESSSLPRVSYRDKTSYLRIQSIRRRGDKNVQEIASVSNTSFVPTLFSLEATELCSPPFQHPCDSIPLYNAPSCDNRASPLLQSVASPAIEIPLENNTMVNDTCYPMRKNTVTSISASTSMTSISSFQSVSPSLSASSISSSTPNFLPLPPSMCSISLHPPFSDHPSLSRSPSPIFSSERTAHSPLPTIHLQSKSESQVAKMSNSIESRRNSFRPSFLVDCEFCTFEAERCQHHFDQHSPHEWDESLFSCQDIFGRSTLRPQSQQQPQHYSELHPHTRARPTFNCSDSVSSLAYGVAACDLDSSMAYGIKSTESTRSPDLLYTIHSAPTPHSYYKTDAFHPFIEDHALSAHPHDISLLTKRLANLQVMDTLCPSPCSQSELEQRQIPMNASRAIEIQQLLAYLAEKADLECKAPLLDVCPDNANEPGQRASASIRLKGIPTTTNSKSLTGVYEQVLSDWVSRLDQLSNNVYNDHPGLKRELDKIRWQHNIAKRTK
ncbi:hypothetical protein BX616_009328 [Lobosporangium transversale]|uniref:Uncharacterized protein n=1 Tax=Lobosporangium transversale TaxID=64571 RepID=A0A1Y2GAY8_9FUNG|nr:hypothetical protein BCR41DRAFT_217689 [Lobosporangium transversale]KAF9919296.1 hypothetical protein BX616_009328 [Lobosporangium transversale]ORY99519.1 hypothetical protein BCR41DRAFT_217689 [Lobosporangium transversale]|eukprot:XP_021875845.1 hypothetical protein BCR41DRAFT_217689 [Lobosporangium transversale]